MNRIVQRRTLRISLDWLSASGRCFAALRTLGTPSKGPLRRRNTRTRSQQVRERERRPPANQADAAAVTSGPRTVECLWRHAADPQRWAT